MKRHIYGIFHYGLHLVVCLSHDVVSVFPRACPWLRNRKSLKVPKIDKQSGETEEEEVIDEVVSESDVEEPVPE